MKMSPMKMSPMTTRWMLACLSTSLVAFAPACRRVDPPCTAYDPMIGNCFDTAISLDDARTMALDPGLLPAVPGACRAPVLVRVQYVRDGDTLDVLGVTDTTFMGGVRLIGVDSPEVEHPPVPADCFGNEARLFTEQLDERLVWLTFDEDCYDPFDRWLAYAWVGGGEGDLWQRQLQRRGFSRSLVIPPNDANAELFAADAMSAVSADRGLWSACAM